MVFRGGSVMIESPLLFSTLIKNRAKLAKIRSCPLIVFYFNSSFYSFDYFFIFFIDFFFQFHLLAFNHI